MLSGAHVDDSWLADAAMVLNCKTGSIPFVYLGLSVVGDARRLNFLVPLTDCIKNRLSSWKKNKNVSMGDHLILLKFVPSSIPVYFLSFFKVPTSIISFIESIFKCFFWVGGGGACKFCGSIGTLHVHIKKKVIGV